MDSLSVIIPSCNGEGKLKNLLLRLNQQTINTFEVVIVLDGSTDNSKNVIEKYRGETQLDIRVIEQKNAGRAAARNTGIKHALNNLCIFIDDDMLPEMQWAERHLNHHRTEKDTLLAGPGFRNPNDAKTPFSEFIIENEKSWAKGRNKKNLIQIENFTFSACNFSVKKNSVEKLGGFDERLKDAEDFDFGLRALQQGYPVFYDPSLIAWHNDWPDIYGYARRHLQYNEGKKELLKIHPEYLHTFPSLNTRKASLVKTVLLKFYRNLFLGMLRPENKIIAFLPAVVRNLYFRLYIACLSIDRQQRL